MIPCSKPHDRRDFGLLRPNEPPGRDRVLAYIPLMRCFLLIIVLALSGCSVLAAPCRITSAVVGAVPVVGGAAATPTNACGNVIDP